MIPLLLTGALAILVVVVFAPTFTAFNTNVLPSKSSRILPSKANTFRTIDNHTRQYAHLGSLGKSDDELRQEQMTLLQQAQQKQELEVPTLSSSWLHDHRLSDLPFECTSCGKCCRTIGDVYMSPSEIVVAANHFNVTAVEFIRNYATHTIGTFPLNDEVTPNFDKKDLPWIILANRKQKFHGHEDTACIFLDADTNHCQIYSIRPIQCSTYPFWTEIMASESLWNDEIRRCDDDDDNHNDWVPFPPWTPESGGCEGMRPISLSGSESRQGDNDDISMNRKGSILIKDALELLALYERNESLLPQGLPEVPVENSNSE